MALDVSKLNDDLDKIAADSALVVQELKDALATFKTDPADQAALANLTAKADAAVAVLEVAIPARAAAVEAATT